MAPERVLLHVGAPKTGTTYLQNNLAAHRTALARDGILYPATRSGAHHAAAWDLRGVPPQRRDTRGIEGSWRRLVEQANAWTGEAVVISSELFVFADREQVRTALTALVGEVHIVDTARDLLRQVPALWQEQVKNQKTVSYPDFLRAVTRCERGAGGRAFWRAQDAAAATERWSRGLAPERVHVVTVPPAGSPHTVLWDRFVSVLGRAGDRYDATAGAPANRSLGLVQTELLRRYNERHGAALPWPLYRRVVWAELDRAFAAVTSDLGRLAVLGAEAAQLAAAAADITARLQRAGYDVVGDLADLNSCPTEAAPRPDSGDPLAAVASEAALLEGALDVLHALLTRKHER